MRVVPKIAGGAPFQGQWIEVRTIYELLGVLRQRPGLHLGGASVTALLHFVDGFYYALWSTQNSFDDEDPPFGDFNDWIAARFDHRYSTRGWCTMLLEDVSGDEKAAFERFYVELDEFRRAKGRYITAL